MPGILPSYACEVYVWYTTSLPVNVWYITILCHWSECMWYNTRLPVSECLVYYQLMPMKWVYAWFTTSLCQWSECIPGILPVYVNEVSVCSYTTGLYASEVCLPAYASEVSIYLVCFQLMPMKCLPGMLPIYAYAWYVTSLCQMPGMQLGLTAQSTLLKSCRASQKRQKIIWFGSRTPSTPLTCEYFFSYFQNWWSGIKSASISHTTQ